jgi:hypothetical protein
MQTSTLIIDDFYNNPEEVRLTGLNAEFNVEGNYPGARTTSYLNDSVKETIQRLIKPLGGEVTYWGEDQYTGAYQYTTKHDTSWVHCDNFNTWAGVCYLTPAAPHNSGTGHFTHTDTGIFRKPANEELVNKLNQDGGDPSKWTLTDVVSNRFNRLVLYRGDFYHSSMLYFGEDKFSGRLFQTFFFDTEY